MQVTVPCVNGLGLCPSNFPVHLRISKDTVARKVRCKLCLVAKPAYARARDTNIKGP